MKVPILKVPETPDEKRDVALYFVEEGEEGFSPERNKYIIEKTIRKNDQLRAKKERAYNDQIRERADAVATYLKSRLAEGSTPVDRYFGKRWISYFQGLKILNKLKTKVMGRERIVHLPTD